MKRTSATLPAVLSVAVLLAVSTFAQHEMKNDSTMIMTTAIQKAIAVLYPTKGHNVTGVITFVKGTDGIKVTAHITGLTPGKHGFHIHEFGDCSADDGMSSGGHFNPTHMQHGAPTAGQRHAGDFGNITADSTGTANFEWIDKMITFEGPSSIIGRALIVHAAEDDLTTQPTGNAGARVACGVIGVDDNQ